MPLTQRVCGNQVWLLVLWLEPAMAVPLQQHSAPSLLSISLLSFRYTELQAWMHNASSLAPHCTCNAINAAISVFSPQTVIYNNNVPSPWHMKKKKRYCRWQSCCRQAARCCRVETPRILGQTGGEWLRCWGVGESLIKSISIIAMCQAVINKQGMVWTVARVAQRVWVQMAFSHHHCPLAYCRALVWVCVAWN